jgi:hypothetical protein
MINLNRLMDMPRSGKTQAPMVWHYTNRPGLEGILRSNTLWASDAETMNDPTEPLMALRGVPLSVVAAWAGHADPAFTLRTYAHAQDEAMRDASTLLARDFGGAL